MLSAVRLRRSRFKLLVWQLRPLGQRRACFDASATACGSSRLNELAVKTCGVGTADKCQRRIELGNEVLMLLEATAQQS